MIVTFSRSVTSLGAVIFVVSPHWSLVTPTILSQMDRGDVGENASLSVRLIALVLLVVHGAPRLLGADWPRALTGRSSRASRSSSSSPSSRSGSPPAPTSNTSC